MDEEKNAITRLVEDIFATQDHEIQCDEARPQIVRSVEANLSDDESQREFPALWTHFRFCPDCAHEYRMLLDLRQAETTGELEYPEHIPPLPGEGRPTMWALAKDAIMARFPGFTPAMVWERAAGDDLGYVLTKVSLGEGQITLILDVGITEAAPHLRDLYVLDVTAADADLQSRLEGASIWLQTGVEGPAVQEQTLSELGDVTFTHIPPGEYTLRLQLAGQDYAIVGVILPEAPANLL